MTFVLLARQGRHYEFTTAVIRCEQTLMSGRVEGPERREKQVVESQITLIHS